MDHAYHRIAVKDVIPKGAALGDERPMIKAGNLIYRCHCDTDAVSPTIIDVFLLQAISSLKRQPIPANRFRSFEI